MVMTSTQLGLIAGLILFSLYSNDAIIEYRMAE